MIPDSALIEQALTHRSAAKAPTQSNERLEFLGDALLGAMVAEWLYRALPTADEAALSRCRMAVIRRETLAGAARTLGLDARLAVGRGERNEGRQTHDGLLADAYEAVLAAVYLDSGADAARTFLEETLGDALAAVRAAPPPLDPKSALQERLQSDGRGLPIYAIASESPDGEVTVEARTTGGAVLGTGTGPSKRLAEREAARQALAELEAPSVP